MIKTELVETKSISRPKGTYTEFSELQWVTNKPLPSVGSEVEVKINGIGRSKVLKYFVEHGFIGLVVPHLVRLSIGPSHKLLIPGSALLGASLAILADLVSRTVIIPAEIPVSLVTSALGAPFFLWLIARARPV